MFVVYLQTTFHASSSNASLVTVIIDINIVLVRPQCRYLAFYKQIAFKRFEKLSPHYFRILKQAVISARQSAHTTSHCQRTNDRISISNLSQQYDWGLQSCHNTVRVPTDLKRTTILVTLAKMQVLQAYGCHIMQNERFGNSEISEVTQTMHFHTALALFMGIMHHLDKMYISGGAPLS
jgi:hypothetical protein